MRRLLFVFIPFLLLSCAQPQTKKTVDKPIEIKFSGLYQKSYSNSKGEHPFTVTCRIRTGADCPPLSILYRYDEEDEWSQGATSESAVNISSSRIEIKDIHTIWPKTSIYYKVELDGTAIATFGRWLPKENWDVDFEKFYTVTE